MNVLNRSAAGVKVSTPVAIDQRMHPTAGTDQGARVVAIAAECRSVDRGDLDDVVAVSAIHIGGAVGSVGVEIVSLPGPPFDHPRPGDHAGTAHRGSEGAALIVTLLAAQPIVKFFSGPPTIMFIQSVTRPRCVNFSRRGRRARQAGRSSLHHSRWTRRRSPGPARRYRVRGCRGPGWRGPPCRFPERCR